MFFWLVIALIAGGTWFAAARLQEHGDYDMGTPLFRVMIIMAGIILALIATVIKLFFGA